MPLISELSVKEQNSFIRFLGIWVVAATGLGYFVQEEKFPVGWMRNFVSGGETGR